MMDWITGVAVLRSPRRRKDVVVSENRSVVVEATDDRAIRFRAASAEIWMRRPITVQALGHPPEDHGYDSIEREEGGLLARARLHLVDGTRLTLTDIVHGAEGCARISREVRIDEAGASAGLRVGLELQTEVDDAVEDAWQYFIPGALYNRNDLDGDGREDYLGTYAQDVRDDKNGLLSILARYPRTEATFSLSRVDRPTFDTAIDDEALTERFFVQATDVGSLGTAPVGNGQVALRASFPFSEETTFSLDTDGTGWAAFAPSRSGAVLAMSYELRLSHTPDLTDAIWALVDGQFDRLGTQRPRPGISPGEALEHRQLLTQLYYRRWTSAENPKQPAGYLVHFSPRTGDTLGSLIEFGFSGDQTLLAYAQTVWGLEQGVPLYVDRAATVIDFFVDHCQLENGFSHGIYDPIQDRFTHWFTGILMPFQYSTGEDDVRRYVGRQIAAALTPVAAQLREVEGNYLRTMCESIYPILLTYERTPHGHDSWLTAGKRFGEFLLATQSDDGSWFRAYTPQGEGLSSPAAWFGSSYAELKTGTIFPTPVLVALHRITGDERFLAAARRAADFIIDTYVEPVLYAGGLNDTTHVKSVKTDSVGVMFLMRSLWKVHEATGETRYLDAAVKAAKVLSSWVFLWDVPFPEATLLGRSGFKSTGWAACDVIPGGAYLDNELLEFVGDLAAVAVAAGNARLLDIAEIVHHGMQFALSTPGNDHGYVAAGIQCEGVMTSYWLSAPDETAFSGAVAKTKGDDNDTCNALTNGQAAFGIYDLRERFGTDDFTEIRQRIQD